MIRYMEQTGAYSEIVAAEVRAEVARQRLTGREVARLVGRPPNTVSRWLNGTVAMDINAFYLVAEALDVDPLEILRRADRRMPGGDEGGSMKRRVSDRRAKRDEDGD